MVTTSFSPVFQVVCLVISIGQLFLTIYQIYLESRRLKIQPAGLIFVTTPFAEYSSTLRRYLFVMALASIAYHACFLVIALTKGDIAHFLVDLANLFFDIRTACGLSVLAYIMLIILNQARVACNFNLLESEQDRTLVFIYAGQAALLCCIVSNAVLRAVYNTRFFAILLYAVYILIIVTVMSMSWLYVYRLSAHVALLNAANSAPTASGSSGSSGSIRSISGYYVYLGFTTTLFIVIVGFQISNMVFNASFAHCFSCLPYYELQDIFDTFSPIVLSLCFIAIYQTWKSAEPPPPQQSPSSYLRVLAGGSPFSNASNAPSPSGGQRPHPRLLPMRTLSSPKSASAESADFTVSSAD